MNTLPPFEHHSPTRLADACAMLADAGGDARLLAGGTDVLLKLRSGSLRTRSLISLRRIPGLGGLTCDAERGLRVGATALLADVCAHPAVRTLYPAVAFAALQTATVQIRNVATVVGNVCNASPCADNPPALLALGATAAITGRGGERRVALEQVFAGPGRTTLAADEVMTAIDVPAPGAGEGCSYQNLSPGGAVGITSVSVAAWVRMRGGAVEAARIVLGAVGPTPLRAPTAEALLAGKPLTGERVVAAGEAAAADARPITDVRATADYRRKMVAVLTRRALQEAYGRAKSGVDHG